MLKMEHHKILSFLDNSHSPSLVVLAMQNWKLPRLIQKEKKKQCLTVILSPNCFGDTALIQLCKKKKVSHLHKRRKEKYLSRG